ncbi:MAG: BamA/TamA family outer membrane protein [Candidatus Latescibacterota bacterium]
MALVLCAGALLGALPVLAAAPHPSAPDTAVPAAQPAAPDSERQRGEALPEALMRVPRRFLEEAPRTLMEAPRVATDQTLEAVRWLAKRRQFTLDGVPYSITGLPIFYYSRSTGWNYGARIQWADYRRLPYRYKVTLHSLHSTANRSDAFFRIRVPRISGTGFGVEVLLRDRRDIRVRYYGRGNDSRYVAAYTNPRSPRFRDEDYYMYVLREPRLAVSLLRHLWGPFNTAALLGLESADVSPRGSQSYYVDEGTPDGVKDGVTGFVGLSLSWDTRDDDVIPMRGTLHEWSYETSRNSVLALFFEEIDYRRYTITDARYLPLTPRLNLAHRTIFEVLSGTVPLYAYGELGSMRPIKGLGGGDSLRGYDTQRFTDNVRFLTNTELRYHLRSMRLYRQYLELHGAVFVDTGRVWPDVDALTPTGLHASGGFGLRIYWNADFVIQLSVALSPEQFYFPVKYRNIF